MSYELEPDIEVVIADDAIDRLAVYVGEWPGEVLVVMDVNTEEVAGADVIEALAQAGARVRGFVFPARSGLIAGEREVGEVRSSLGAGERLIAVGSGVITDIVRYAAQLEDREFIAVPTAASMDGYASSMAALQLEGVKVTYPARAPVAIFADPRVAAAAPSELTRAGIGDLLGKATARVDWLAAHLLYGESFSPSVADRVLEPLASAAANVDAVMAGDADAVRALLGGLIQSGIAMAVEGSSRPASGCEHHASHFWDLLAAQGKRPHAPHGLQVGYGTRFAMRLQRFAFGGGVSTLARPLPAADPLGPDARRWLGEPTPEIVAAVEEKQRFIAAVPDSWPDSQEGWDALRARLSSALELFPHVDSALTTAGIPAEPGFLGLDEATLRATFRYATRLRARYTAIDFLEGQGALEHGLDAAISP